MYAYKNSADYILTWQSELYCVKQLVKLQLIQEKQKEPKKP